MRTKRIDQDMFDILKRQFERGKGVSRYAQKQKGLFTAQTNKIYSKSTFKTYRQQCKTFCKWARENDIRKLKDLNKADVGRWLEIRQHKKRNALPASQML